jgi:hypothetical protein
MVDRQMQGHQGRDAWRRQIFGEIMTVAVHDVDKRPLQYLLDPPSMGSLRTMPELFGEDFREWRGGNELTRRFGAATGDNQRPVACRDQGPVERCENLLRAAGSVGTDRCENVGDTENRQTHSGERKPSASSAARA